jgi:multicomponent Na+:H+ antiporter subunit C
MTGLLMALVVGVLFGGGTYLLLQRSPIRLILGLALLSHGVNLLLFSGGKLKRGLPPIILDKTTFSGEISSFVDPLPQALILTAIVISFGVTAFIVVLVNRRNTIVEGREGVATTVDDPFALSKPAQPIIQEDYEFLEYPSVTEYRKQKS